MENNDDWWSRAAALSDRRTVAGRTPPAKTWEDGMREAVALRRQNELDNMAVTVANKALVSRGYVLARNDLFSDPTLGRFVIKKISDGSVVAADVNPQRVAGSLAYSGQIFYQ